MQEIIAPEHVQDPWEKNVPGLVPVPTPMPCRAIRIADSHLAKRGCRSTRKEPSTMRGSGTRLDAVSFSITATAPHRARLARIVGSRVPAPTEVVPNDGFICELETGESGSPRQSP
jgi:hypothetical protein